MDEGIFQMKTISKSARDQRIEKIYRSLNGITLLTVGKYLKKVQESSIMKN